MNYYSGIKCRIFFSNLGWFVQLGLYTYKLKILKMRENISKQFAFNEFVQKKNKYNQGMFNPKYRHSLRENYR